MRIGLISDTHGLLRPSALQALEGCGHIIHAGDIGDPSVLERLRELAPLTVIRGNIDTAPWARELPAAASVELGGRRFFVLHDLRELGQRPEDSPHDVVVFGHSHRPEIRDAGRVLLVNPGSAGPRRFRLPVTLALMETETDAEPHLIHLD